MSFLDKVGLKRTYDGRSKHILYKHWRSMMNLSYGMGRDITVDERWHNFWNFVNDLKDMYDKKYKYLCRIDASNPFMLGNVWFTNSGRKANYGRTTTHKVKVGNIKMTTSQIKRELESKGIYFNQQTLTIKVAKGKELIEKNKHQLYEYKGKLCSLKSISEKENIVYHSLKYFAANNSISDAIKLSRESNKTRVYNYDGNKFNQTELAKYLHIKNPELTVGGIRNRLKKGLSIEECLKPLKSVSFKSNYLDNI